MISTKLKFNRYMIVYFLVFFDTRPTCRATMGCSSSSSVTPVDVSVPGWGRVTLEPNPPPPPMLCKESIARAIATVMSGAPLPFLDAEPAADGNPLLAEQQSTQGFEPQEQCTQGTLLPRPLLHSRGPSKHRIDDDGSSLPRSTVSLSTRRRDELLAALQEENAAALAPLTVPPEADGESMGAEEAEAPGGKV